MSEPTSPKPKHGGARKGAGSKPLVQGAAVRSATIRLAAEDEATLRDLGDGVLSLGIQRAAQIVRERKG